MDIWKRTSFIVLLGVGSFLSADKEPSQGNIKLTKDYSLLQEAKLNYVTAAKTFNDFVKERKLSESELDDFFLLIKEALDEYRYKSHLHQKLQIVDLAYQIEGAFGKDIDYLIDKVILFLQDLKIEYHNIQHTLEVALGTARASFQGFKEGLIKDSKEAILPIVAALFHDIGYSNAKEARSLINKLSCNEYAPLFFAIKGQSFIDSFEETLKEIEDKEELIGAELHLYHVPLSQVLLPIILKSFPCTFENKEFFLSSDSLEKMNAMISLTDIKADVNKYRDNRRQYLGEQGLLFAGESLATCDLLTQLSTSDRLGKGLGLYHEFFLGKDSNQWGSGLALMATSTGFYEFFAKNQLNTEVLSVLDRYFKESFFSDNPYRLGDELIFFLHKLFEPLYEKLLCFEAITDEDVWILKGLHKNGLQKEVVQLFLATKMIQEGVPLPFELEESFYAILRDKDSCLEVAIGDELRMVLIRGAAYSEKSRKVVELLNFRKPEIFVNRFCSFSKSLQMMGFGDKEEFLNLAGETFCKGL